MKSSTYNQAREVYAEMGVDTEAVIRKLSDIPISLQCWQGDDVGGFESAGAQLSDGGIQATGNYPGKARSLPELRADLDVAVSLLPGKNRVNLHACYGDFGGKKTDRNEISIKHFQSWINWANERKLGLDFNPTFFSHPLAKDGWTLAHQDAGIRQFWIEHGIACRKIGAEMGRQTGSLTVTNVWIPDGFKDFPFDRKAPRERLQSSLDALFKDPIDPKIHLDAVESKLFGIGSESYVVGSHEFYMGYAIKNQKMICLDAGHFHPTESIGDKISSLLLFVPRLLLHVSRGVRWDSDHVVIVDDPTRAIMQEVVRCGLDRIHIGMDFFDASINRIAAWVIGARSTRMALLQALLEPVEKIRNLEKEGDLTSRLALLEECKNMPFGIVWNEFCDRNNTPYGFAWMQRIKQYERENLSTRSH